MKAMIIEDERMAREQLANVLRTNFPEIEVVKMTDSVQSSVEYLDSSVPPDIIFMDVELLDGSAFQIFRMVDVCSSVIMTTAYDSYAVKAFEAGSIDYLLKPISLERLKSAVERCQRGRKDFKKILTIHFGNRIIPVSTEDTAYICSESKANYLMTFRKERYLIDSTMDMLEKELDPNRFTRISRGCIINRRAIESVRRDRAGHLTVNIGADESGFAVSRPRMDAFLKWLKNQ
ncbi:MAG: LytTR family DNA-binding domain-containing protein [Bacteroidales bacterium]|nr:LytTR family DNA-binding domain-containing protein [Bacteroidales bacterium]